MNTEKPLLINLYPCEHKKSGKNQKSILHTDTNKLATISVEELKRNDKSNKRDIGRCCKR